MSTSNNLNIHPPEGLPRKFFKGIGRYKMVYTINDMNQEDEKAVIKFQNDKAPQTTVDGPVVNRTIPLPALNSFSSQEKLIPKEEKHEKLNGIINPVLDIKMDGINTDNSTWSDTSSDNMKDPSSSRASTLTRDLKDDDGIMRDTQSKINEYSNKYSEAKEKSNSFPRYTQLGTHSEPLRDFSSSVPNKLSSKKVWDVFRIASREPNKPIDGSYLSLFRKITKVFVSVVLTIMILVTAMLSKSSLLLITSNIHTNVTLKCTKTHQLGHVTHCQRVSAEEADDHPYQLSQTVEVSWLWALFTVVCTPYLMTFFKCLWRVLFKKTRKPTFNILIICLAIETLHTIGICIFVFYLLPELDPIRGLMLTFGVAFVPSLLKIFDRQSEGGKQYYVVFLDVIAMLVQLSILIIWPLRDIMHKEDYQNAWCIFVSLLLISVGWWENYVNKFTEAGKISQTLREIKHKVRRMRTKVYMIISIWKIVLTLGMMLALMSNLKLSCVEVLFYRGKNRATECPHFAYPTDGYNVESWTYKTDPFWVAIIQIFSGLFCYTFCKTACKIMLQVVSFSLPLMLAAPIMVGLFIGNCETWKSVATSNFLMPDYMFWTCDIHGISEDFLEKLISEYYLPITVGWWLSFMWVTFHIWIPRVERLVQTERLFVQPLYCGVMLEQSLMLNRRRDDRDRDFRSSEKELRFKFEQPFDRNRADKYGGILPGRSSLKTDRTPMIYVCATMWHETQKEMVQVLTSLMRLDNDQCARKNAQKFFDVVDPDYYEFEAHIFFDDAYDAHEDDDYEYSVNSFVKQLVLVMDTAASKVHNVPVKIPPPTKYPTPYGGRLEWVLPGNNKLCAHLKDKTKIRHKKRWSQVMYMYYLLGLKLVSQPLDARRKQTIADNSFILALDGDVDFKPSAVQLLVDRMKKNEKVGAACGRIHPVGTGPMVWYQKFEYAVSHWLQKATEHMIGCVLCSPGCFSLFRASSLMDDNVMRKYATVSNHARHYVQYDQGEDRWLCTLLLQQGYRVEYSAAADALTVAPEGFAEFFNQRRRWSPSTMANIMDLLMDWKNVIRMNESISFLYIMYQGLLFMSSIVTPGTIFLLIVGALNSAFKLDLITSLMINLAPMAIFLISCFFVKGKWQILLAEFLSLFYSLVMMVVVVGLGLEMKREGLCSPTTIFLIFVVGTFIIAAILHPQEFYCLFHGVLYFLCIPSMSMLLMIYSICNLHVVSWGTRENAIASQPNQKPKKETKESKFAMILSKLTGDPNTEDSDYSFSFGNLFKCLCCPKPKVDDTEQKFAEVLAKLEVLEESITKPKTGPSKSVKDAETNVNDEDLNTNEGQRRKQENGIRYNPIYQPKASPQEDDTPYWIHDDDIGHGKIRYISKEEKLFWHELIDKYLYPLQHNEKHKKKMEQDLLELRNKMSLMFFMMNALFIIIIFSLQYSNATDLGSGLSIPLPCHDTVTGESLSLEPISLVFMAIFGIALLIQFISMFFHRLATFLHIMSTTEVNCMKPNQNEIAAMDIASKVQLVKEMQRFEDDDDTRSISTIGSDIDEDSSITQDDSPKIKRKKTVLKLTRRKRSQAPQSGNLSGKFLRKFMEMAKDMENGGNGNKKRSGSSKRSKNAKKAMEALEQNKDVVLNKAHVIKSRWQRLVKASKWDSSGDKWGSLMRNVIGQSRTSLNTITEDDKRNSWIRGLSRMTRSNSEFSVSTLPDLGSWSVRNSYAEPILNIITDELENTNPGAGRPETINENQTVVEINNSASSSNTDDSYPSKQENLYDAVEELNSSNSDSDLDSDYEVSVVPKGNNSSAATKTSDIELKPIGANDSKGNPNNGDTHL